MMALLGLQGRNVSGEVALDRIQYGQIHNLQLSDADLGPIHVEILVVAQDQFAGRGALHR